MSLPFHTPLDAAAQINAGIDPPAALALADRVHHDDLDALLHVNNVTYLVWFERLRIRFMEMFDIGTIGDIHSPRIVIRSAEMHWIEEMLKGEDYIVTCDCTALRRTSMTLSQSIWAGGRKRAQFDCVMVLLAQDGSGRIAIPEPIRQRLLDNGARDDA